MSSAVSDAPAAAVPRPPVLPTPEATPEASAEALARLLPVRPAAAVVLGSGFAPAVDKFDLRGSASYRDIPGFPAASVTGHAGRVLAGFWTRTPVLIFSGRAHYYEGHSMQDLAFPVRALKALGVKRLVLTAAVGSCRKAFKPGELAAVRDHINWMGDSPLRGRGVPEGTLFTDLGECYAPALRHQAVRAARRAGLSLRQVTHAACMGPAYETPAEITALKRLGADSVGMSLVPEALAAASLGLETLALVGAANYAAGLSRERLTHEEVLETIAASSRRLARLLDALLPAWGDA